MLFLVCGFWATPLMEDDHFRFLWDGRQFATTGNPYVPPPAGAFGDATVPDRFQDILDQINYPHVPTIYGPICQIGFVIGYWLAPGQLWPWRLILFSATLGLMQLSVLLARHGPREPRGAVESSVGCGARSALFVGWCPLLVFETGFNAHPDLLGITFLAAALYAATQKRDWMSGVLCGLAVGAKLFALLLVPFLCRRSRQAWLGFTAALVLFYAPFWLQGTGADFAGLVTFAKDWEFNSSVYALIRWGFGITVAKALCGFVFIAVWLVLFLRWWNRAPAGAVPPGAAVFAVLFLTAATVNPWYLLWLLPFLALRPSVTGMAALALVSLSYITGLNLGVPMLGNFEHPIWVRPVEYGAVALVGVIEISNILRGAHSRNRQWT
jgi:hypothetical protein